MKKFLIVLLAFCIINITQAQSTSLQTQSSDYNGQIISQKSGPNPQSLEILSKAGIRFCNDGIQTDKLTKSLKLDIRPGETQDICVIFYNQNTFPIKIIPGISAGSYEKQGQFLCDQDSSTTNSTYEILQASRKDQEIELPSEYGKVILRTGTIAAPTNASGTLPICFGITLLEETKKTAGGVFNLRHRRGYQMMLNITGDIYKPSLSQTIKENKYTILKIITGIIGLLLIICIVQQIKHKKKKHKSIKNKK